MKMKVMKRRSGSQPLTTRRKRKKKQIPPGIQPRLEYPWFLCRTGGTTGFICCNTSSDKYKGYTTSFPDDIDVKCVFNCCYGWLIFRDSKNNFCLWNLVVCKLIKLPQFEWKRGQSISGAVLSSPGNRVDDLDPNCMIMIFIRDYDFEKSQNRPSSITYCLFGEQRWKSVVYDDELRDLFFKPVILNDLVYAEGLRSECQFGSKLFCINRVDSTGIMVTEYCKIPRSTMNKDEHKYLVESCGELFYIIITWTCSNGQRLSDIGQRVSDLQAFKLNQVSMRFNRVSEVGDRVFFFDGHYLILSCAARIGDKGGFLYYICPCPERCFYSYIFADNSVSTSSFHSMWNIPKSFDKPILYLPDRRLIDEPDFGMNLVEMGRYDPRKIREETRNCKIYTDENEEKETLLFCLPHVVIKFITALLNPVDYLNFRSVSKFCRLQAPKIEWREASMNLAHAPSLSPWLVSSGNRSGIYKFVDSRLGGKYFMKIPKSLADTKIIDSYDGWLLLMSNSFKTLSFYNPFTTQIVKMPKLRALSPHIRFPNITIVSSPASSYWGVVAIAAGYREIEINLFEVGKRRWDSYFFEFDITKLFLGFFYCPVYHQGDIYFLGNNGDLGYLKFSFGEPVSWNVLEITKEPNSFFNQNFLLECDDVLFAVSMDEVGKSINVFAIHWYYMSWVKVDDLGEYTFYLSRSTSFCTDARADWMKNIIFFPRLSDDDSIVYYSMNTRKLHTVANKDDEVEFANTRELILPGWIQPSWS